MLASHRIVKNANALQCKKKNDVKSTYRLINWKYTHR
jgi:hypothetical protein